MSIRRPLQIKERRGGKSAIKGGGGGGGGGVWGGGLGWGREKFREEKRLLHGDYSS